MKRILALLMMTVLTASIIPLHVSADATQDIPTNAANTGVHDSLVAALTHANLVSTLQGTGHLRYSLQQIRHLSMLG